MKLWQKAALSCVAVLAAVVAVCSAAMLLYARHTILDICREQTLTRQRDLAASFSEMAGYYLLDKDSDAVRDSLVRYCFARFADDTSVLMRGGETISSALDIDPSALAETDGAGTAGVQPWNGGWGGRDGYEGKVRGRDILMACSTVLVRGEEYTVYTVVDVTDIHRDLVRMALIFLAVSLGGIGAGAGAVTLLMRRGAKPLAALSAAARRIAGGEYGIRADVRSQDEIGALAEDFNTMAGAVQRHVAELSETAERQRLFIGGVTHEFKTPLTAILLHARLLQRVNMTEAERADSLACIERQCAWLESLTQKLLKVITLRQDIVKKPIPARELAERVRDSTRRLMADRDVKLEIDCGGEALLVDADLMQSLLVNLVDNAGKAYDPGDGERTVWLTIRAGVLEVRDAGRGIPPEAVGRVFEPFYRVDKSRSKKLGGSGLGLALAKHIADVHGARLEVESAVGQGTVFRVVLPR